MSRVRTRPTRGETREKLFQAAAEVFEEQGIGAASIEAIAAAAGLTRGAFYSNFADKDELIAAMLEDHVEQALAFHRTLLAQHKTAADFVAALRATERSRLPTLPTGFAGPIVSPGRVRRPPAVDLTPASLAGRPRPHP